MALSLIASGANAAVLASDDFSYADGLLVPQGGWTYHSGNDDFMIVSGEAVIEHGTPSGDVNVLFTPTTGMVYFSFDFSVDDLGAPWAGTDSEYFAHFMDSGYGYRTRVDIVPPSGGGDFTLGVATSGGSADATWATDLTYGVDYHVVGSYNQDANISRLWIDPVGLEPPYIMGADNDDPGDVMEKFGMRQSDSSLNEIIRLDNLIIADACEDVFETCPTVPNETHSWGEMKSLYR